MLVAKGDRLGVYLEEAPGAIAFKFVAAAALTLGYTVQNLSSPTAINDTIRFDSPIFPYLFSAAAYVDTGQSRVTTDSHVTVVHILL